MDNIQITFHPQSTEQGGVEAIYSPIFDVSAFGRLSVALSVFDAGGTTPTLTTVIQTSMDGNNWALLISFNAVSGRGDPIFQSADTTGRFVRARYNFTGTLPWFNFSLLAIAREW